MLKRSTCFVVLGFAATAAGNAYAQDPPAAGASVGVSTDAGASTEAGASADAAATAEAPPAPAVEAAPAPAEEPYEPYPAGLPPDGNVLELGIFGGLIIPSKDHNLRYEAYPQREYDLGALGGGRLGYYPLSWLGLEGEVMAASTTVKDSDFQGVMYAYRGSLVLQVPTPYIAPFALGGVGNLGAVSRPMGNDVDTAWHFGIGAKIPFTHILGMRLDLRDNLTAHQNKSGQAHTFEVQLGLYAVIERERKALPPPPPDADQDNVPDADDKCPNEPGVAPSGCPADTDGDSVYDKDDYCPREAGPAPKGCPIVDPDPDKDGVPLPCDLCPEEIGVKPDGCPIRDTDKDGILDDKDKCINEPETKNGFEDADGCPDKIPDAVQKFSGVVQGIYFAQGKAVVRPASKATLMRAVKVLQDHPSISFEISGHTSSEGDKAFNDKLSQDRADAVKQWLVDQGVDPKRLRTRGAGSDEPIADNKTYAGREKNRRIEFKVIQ